MDETVVGVKTGFTDEAGRCLVSACVRNGIMLICVTLNDRDDWQDHERLYDYGFGQLTPAEVSFPTDWSIAVAGGTAQQVTLIPEGTIVAGTRDGKAPALEFQLETAPFLYAPVTAGQDAGTWKALCGGRVAAQGRLCAGESA
ncbi:MAG: D-alanyl-D-alanine carboxypeptidase, partial [Ruminococcus sp.]